LNPHGPCGPGVFETIDYCSSCERGPEYGATRLLETPHDTILVTVCPSFLRLRVPIAAAMIRFSRWLGCPELAAPVRVKILDASDLACDESGQWKGAAVFLYEVDGWTVFEDQSGELGALPPSRWQALAEKDELVFAGYNDAIHYGELVVIENGVILRAFMDDEDDPGARRDVGRLPQENTDPLRTWIDVASLVDDDPILRKAPGEGLLWIHASPR
jgi:hypothetical protein